VRHNTAAGTCRALTSFAKAAMELENCMGANFCLQLLLHQLSCMVYGLEQR
jgi:hypothetical protein